MLQVHFYDLLIDTFCYGDKFHAKYKNW
jgi:hypothetical protein